jgi:hypothetical protein
LAFGRELREFVARGCNHPLQRMAVIGVEALVILVSLNASSNFIRPRGCIAARHCAAATARRPDSLDIPSPATMIGERDATRRGGGQLDKWGVSAELGGTGRQARIRRGRHRGRNRRGSKDWRVSCMAETEYRGKRAWKISSNN